LAVIKKQKSPKNKTIMQKQKKRMCCVNCIYEDAENRIDMSDEKNPERELRNGYAISCKRQKRYIGQIQQSGRYRKVDKGWEACPYFSYWDTENIDNVELINSFIPDDNFSNQKTTNSDNLKATLIIKRKKQFRGKLINLTLYINNQKIDKMGTGDVREVKVLPGFKKIQFKSWDGKAKPFELEIKANERIILEVGTGLWGLYIKRINQEFDLDF
jgi:hypothetical protein